jgi:hypothetical protein
MSVSYFPITEDHPAMRQAMDIAMGYVEGTGLAAEFVNPEYLVATAIYAAWRRGVRHQILLANEGIVTAAKTAQNGVCPSLFPQLF